jgi:hypothetical protein
VAAQLTNEEFHAYIAGLERARREYVERHLALLGADPAVAVFHQHDNETGALRYIYYVHHTEHSGRKHWQLSFVYVDAKTGRELPTTHEIYKTLDEVLTELYHNRAELVEVRQVRPTASNPLIPNEIKQLVPKLIEAAQKVYDEWEQNEEGEDPELGYGGICQDIADEMAGVLNENGVEAGTVSATAGDQHVWVIAKLADGVYDIDIPPYLYESGSGYTWKKRPNVKFTKEMLAIGPNDIDFDLAMEENPTRPAASNPPELAIMTSRVGDGMKGLVYSEEPGVDFFSWFINPMTGDPHHLDGHEYVTAMMMENGLDSWPPPLYTLAYLDNNIDVAIMGSHQHTKDQTMASRTIVKDILSHLDVKGNPWVSVWRGASGVWRGTVADFRAQADLLGPKSHSTAQNPGKRGRRPAPADTLADTPVGPGMKGIVLADGETIAWFMNWKTGDPHHEHIMQAMNEPKARAFLTFTPEDVVREIAISMIEKRTNESSESMLKDAWKILETSVAGRRGNDGLVIEQRFEGDMLKIYRGEVGEFLREAYGVTE